MLQTIDKALAGAIDVVADDIQATVKAVREQGLKATLKDAVEDAAGLVASGAGSVLAGVLPGKRRGPETISTHSGVASSYADLCAGPGGRSMTGYAGGGGSNGAAFQYIPQPKTGGYKPSAGAAPKFPSPAGGFGPGIGIQRAAPSPGAYNPGGVQVFANPGGVPPGMGFNPYTPSQLPGPYPAAPPAAASYATGGGAAAPPAGKEPTLPPDELANRVEAIKQKEAANNSCFDCGAGNPEWASVSFGVLLCIQCGGFHRQMGTHISRVRSCKMDSWTERQLQVFDHGGNRRLADFFAANGITNAVRYQRYHTPAAEWYREAWIKNRTLGREVPPPPQGVVAGPCSEGAAAAKAAPAAPPADLLDFGGGGGGGGATGARGGQADLLDFGDEPAARPAAGAGAAAGGGSAPAEFDLLGIGAAGGGAGGDLLGLGGGDAGGGGDLLGLGGPPASGGGLGGLAGLDLGLG